MSDSGAPEWLSWLRERLETTEWFGLVAVGVLSFVAGYVLVGALAFVGRWPTEGVGITGGLLTIGFAFYSAHGILVDAGGVRFDFLAGSGGEVPLATYYAVPILVLLVAGVLVYRRYGRDGLHPLGTLLNAVGMALGYVLMAALGTFVFVTSTIGGGTASVPLVDASALTALYVLVFGFIGGAVASAVDVYVRRP